MGEQLPYEVRLGFASRIRQADVDRVLRSSRIYRKEGWSRVSASGRLMVDLSRVEFIDFGAAARILAAIEGSARFGWKVSVVPPSRSPRPSEADFLAEKRSDPRIDYFRQGIFTRVKRRRRAEGFLRNTGFFRALEMPHLGDCLARPTLVPPDRSASATIETESDTLIGSPSENEEAASTKDDAPRPTILPFRWVSHVEPAATWQQDFVTLLSTQLTKTDSESLVQHVVNELIENVREHAADDAPVAPFALVGAMVFNSRGRRYLPRPDMFYEASEDYIEWLRQQTTPVVRLFVLDSGRGLTATIQREFGAHLSGSEQLTNTSERNHAIALYAFDAGSSRLGRTSGRGIGLPAVRRFVRSCRGLIAVRAANISSGYACQHGSLEELKNAPLAYAPGTAVEIILALGLRARASLDQRTADGMEPVALLWMESSGSELPDVSRRVDAAVQNTSAHHPVVLLSVNSWPRDRRVAFSHAILVSKLANALSGRAGLAVFLPGLPDSEFDTTFGAVDEVREQGDQDTMDGFRIQQQSTPFLVVPSSGRERWSGGSRELRGLLYDLSEGKAVDGAGLRFQDSDLDYLRTERDWLAWKDGTLRLRLQPREIDRKIATVVASDLATALGLRPPGFLEAESEGTA